MVVPEVCTRKERPKVKLLLSGATSSQLVIFHSLVYLLPSFFIIYTIIYIVSRVAQLVRALH